jgi:hypothetical protein
VLELKKKKVATSFSMLIFLLKATIFFLELLNSAFRKLVINMKRLKLICAFVTKSQTEPLLSISQSRELPSSKPTNLFIPQKA